MGEDVTDFAGWVPAVIKSAERELIFEGAASG
jgi:hypothetical protein